LSDEIEEKILALADGIKEIYIRSSQSFLLLLFHPVRYRSSQYAFFIWKKKT